MASMILRRSARSLMSSSCSTVARGVRASSSANGLLTPEQMAYPANIHRSNAQELVSKVPVIEVDSLIAMCDGGGGATGHPIEFIKLDKRTGKHPAVCKFCGLRYKASAHAHGGH